MVVLKCTVSHTTKHFVHEVVLYIVVPFIKVWSNVIIKKTLIGYKIENKCNVKCFP